MTLSDLCSETFNDTKRRAICATAELLVFLVARVPLMFLCKITENRLQQSSCNFQNISPTVRRSRIDYYWSLGQKCKQIIGPTLCAASYVSVRRLSRLDMHTKSRHFTATTTTTVSYCASCELPYGIWSKRVHALPEGENRMFLYLEIYLFIYFEFAGKHHMSRF